MAMSGALYNAGRLDEYRARFQTLRMATHGDRPRPHKAVMLLAVLSLADNGLLIENKVVYGPELLELCKRYFAIVRGPTDQCTPLNPSERIITGSWTAG